MARPESPSSGAMLLRQYDLWKAVYLRTFRGNVVSNLFYPLFNVLAMGVLLGGYVDVDPARLEGASSYLAFVIPGLLAGTTMMTAFGDSSYPVVGALKWDRTFYAMQSTPLRVRDIVNGSLVYIAFRSLVAAVVFVAVLVPFGVFETFWAPFAAVAASLLVAIAFAAPMHALSVLMNSEQPFSLFWRIGVMPLFLFSGAFFPLTNLSPALAALAKALPLWHGVDLTRMMTLDTLDPVRAAIHIGYLGVLAAVGYVAAVRTLQARLSA